MGKADDAVDLCYIKDAARAIALLQTAEKLQYDVYNKAQAGSLRIENWWKRSREWSRISKWTFLRASTKLNLPHLQKECK